MHLTYLPIQKQSRTADAYEDGLMTMALLNMKKSDDGQKDRQENKMNAPSTCTKILWLRESPLGLMLASRHHWHFEDVVHNLTNDHQKNYRKCIPFSDIELMSVT